MNNLKIELLLKRLAKERAITIKIGCISLGFVWESVKPKENI